MESQYALASELVALCDIELQASCRVFVACAFFVQPFRHIIIYVASEHCQVLEFLCCPVYKECCYGRWRLQPCVSYEVYHGIVTLVPNARQYWDGKLCYVRREGIRFKSLQVACGTTSAQYTDAVVVLGAHAYLVEGGDDALFDAISLHYCGEELGAEVIRRSFQLSCEVAKPCRRCA